MTAKGAGLSGTHGDRWLRESPEASDARLVGTLLANATARSDWS